MTRHPVVAIDPGADGGAVILEADGKTARAAYRWRKNPKGFLLRELGKPAETLPTLYDVGKAIKWATRGAPYWLGVEGLFVPRLRKANPTKKDLDKYTGKIRHILTLAESTALLYAPLLSNAAHIKRPTAAVWRPVILSIPANCPSDFAEQHAILAMTRLRPVLVSGLGELATDPHVAEAACIARYVWLCQAGKMRR